MINTFAGTGYTAATLDGMPAVSTNLQNPSAIWADPMGNMYYSDGPVFTIRSIAVGTTIVTTIAGAGSSGPINSGVTATAATFGVINGLFGDTANGLYIVDSTNCNILRMNLQTGFVYLFAGSGASTTSSGDGGAATSALMYNPAAVWADTNSAVYLSDGGNKIRKVGKFGKISTIAGTGIGGVAGDGGAATAATVNSPSQLFGDSVGLNLYCVMGGASNKVR